MAQANSIYHVRVLENALELAEQAGREQDALRREALIGECMQLWRIAQRLKDRNRKARSFAAQALAQYAGSGAYTAMDIPHNTTWEIK